MPNAILWLAVLVLLACFTLVPVGVNLVKGSAEFPVVLLDEVPEYLACASYRFTGMAMHDCSPIASVEYSCDYGAWTPAEAVDEKFGESTIEEFSFSVSLGDGPHVVLVKATTAAGYSTAPDQYASACFVIDTVRPTIFLCPVLPDPIPKAGPMLTGWAADIGSSVARVEYSIDGADWLLATATDGTFDSASEDFSIGLNALSDGAHTVAARAVDAAGNTSDMAEYSFVVDTCGPAMVMDSLPAYVSKNALSCTGQAVDVSSRIVSVLFSLDHGEWSAASATDGAFDESMELWEFSLSDLTDGLHELEVTGVDDLGNVTLDREIAVATFLVDTVSPMVSLLWPDDDGTDSTHLTVKGLASDVTSPIVAVLYRIDGGGWANAAADDGAFDETEEAFRVAVGTVPAGEYLIEATALDAAGNESAMTSVRLAILPATADDVDDEERHEGSQQTPGDADRLRIWWLFALIPVLAIAGLVTTMAISRRRRETAGDGMPSE